MECTMENETYIWFATSLPEQDSISVNQSCLFEHVHEVRYRFQFERSLEGFQQNLPRKINAGAFLLKGRNSPVMGTHFDPRK